MGKLSGNHVSGTNLCNNQNHDEYDQAIYVKDSNLNDQPNEEELKL